MRRAGTRPGIPVICLGNLTMGGAGKTPAALAVARLLIARGERPFFLTRGYGGRHHGPVMVEPDRHSTTDVGDEPVLLARLAPTIVARARPAGATLARERGASAIVMDDGFQNPSLHKDLSILVVDGQRGIGNGRVFPAGPLRAPLQAQLERAHALIVVGEIGAAAAVATRADALNIPVFTARLEPDAQAIAALRSEDVLAFAGIADPPKFFAMLRSQGVRIRAARAFADHHRYSARETERLLAEADRHGCVLVTTEKDLVRIAREPHLEILAHRVQAVPVELVLDRPADFERLVTAVLEHRTPQPKQHERSSLQAAEATGL